VEHQKLRARSFDVVIANDLLEHLADPRATMRRCVELVKPEGLLVIQTPKYEVGRTYDELVAEDDPFLDHMRRARTEHLYLFSRNALELLLAELGVEYFAFEEPVYPYDMICVASRTTLRRTDREPSALAGAGKTGPLVLALIDAHDAWQGSERDRADRLVAIERLDGALNESEVDRAARLEVIERLDAALKESEADRATRLEIIERLNVALKESEAGRSVEATRSPGTRKSLAGRFRSGKR
jgi:SAM-dependent methyltransferase